MSYTLPDLPYDYDALEPHIDEQTMRVHHDKHHKGYTDKVNKALEGTEFADTPISEVLGNINDVPEDIRQNVINNGGGFANHKLFWTVLSPDGGGEPTGAIADAIDEAFGSFEEFKDEFQSTATG
jgi:Fe-Mn family superoxide dismutase